VAYASRIGQFPCVRLPMPVIRVFFLALISVTASAYALVRYYTRQPEPMIVAPAQAVDSGEIPAPDIEPQK
jgi:hypothetical protein